MLASSPLLPYLLLYGIGAMQEERLIIVCSIHQPSTKVYTSFDKVMILSRGRQAFSGAIEDAPAYFEEIGYPIPEQMNPAGE